MTVLQRSRLLPALLLASVLALGLALVVGGTSPLRSLLVVWFLLACPGLALAPLIGLHDAIGTATVAITLSISIDLIVVGALLYAGTWSPVACYVLLASITIAGAARQLAASAGVRA